MSKAMWMNRGLLALISIVATSWILSGCSGGEGWTPSPDTLIFARGADSLKLDPADITDGESVKVCTNIYEGLLEYTDTGTDVQPCLAESWETTDDGRVYTFKLRRGVEFHDGSALDAAAVVTSFERQRDPGHPYNFGLAYIYWEAMFAKILDSIEAVDPATVRITLKAAYAPFLANMAMFPVVIVSPAALEKHGEAIARNPVGTGAFRFVRWIKDQDIVLERNPSYWREQAKAPSVQFLSIVDNNSRVLRMKQGEFRLMDGLSTDHFDVVEEAPALRLVRQPGMNVAYLSLNHSRPPFDDVRVRRAVCHALRKEVIVSEAYGGHARAAKNPMPPTLWGYNDAVEDYAHDREKARALLVEAGKSGAQVEIFVMQNPRPYMPDPDRIAQLIKEDLKAIGLQVKIRPTLWEDHLTSTQNGEHDMALLGWTSDNGDPDNFIYTLLDKDNAKPGHANNISFYESDELHEVLIAAQEVADQGERAKLYEQAQEIVHRDVGFIPLVHTEQTIVLDKRIQGFQLHPTGTLRLRKTWLQQ